MAGLVASFALHLLALLIPMLVLFDSASPVESERSQRAIPLFIPRPQPVEAEVPQPVRLSFPEQVRVPILRPEESDPPRVEVPIDMNSIQLSFAEDVANELPEVVRMNGGVFALADKAEPGFARYVIEPPDWTVRETLTDTSGKIRFAMDPPQKWNLLRSVAQVHSIQLDDYQASALFGGAYVRCLGDAIRARVREMVPVPKGRIVSARLSFSAGNTCGIRVLEVSFAPDANR
jgi:hypothetical protein